MGKNYKNYKDEDQNANVATESEIMEAPVAEVEVEAKPAVEEPKKEEPKVEVKPAPVKEAKKPTTIKGRGTVTC